jgi:hypothetical protein
MSDHFRPKKWGQPPESGLLSNSCGRIRPVPDLLLGGAHSFLENLFHAVIVGCWRELACPQPDRLLDCRVGGGEDQRPHSMRFSAVVVWVRQGRG